MSKLSDINHIKELMKRHGVNFSKSLGQNFLINPTVCPRMAETCEDENVIEVGPGVGVLTYELSEYAKKVVSVELDKKLLPVLKDSLSECENVKIVSGDILKIDLNKLIEEEFEGERISVCANLPYYITSPIIMKLLEEKLPINTITVMVQKEAAQRLCALPGTRECGAVSLAVRYYCEPEILFGVSKGSFLPAPKVDSAVIKLNVFDKPSVSVKSEELFFKLIKAGFSQRRKNLVNSLSSGLGMSKDIIKKAMKNAEIEENKRAEALSIDDFANLCDSLYEETNAK